MATDHYTRLGIEKEKFYELDEKGKEELVEKQFRGLTGSLLSKLFDIFFPGLAEKRLVKLRDARDILKSELKADNIDGKENITVDYNNNQSQEQTKNNNTKSLNLDEQIEQIKEKLEKIKTGREGREGDITRNETVSKVITHLESELKGLMENVLKIKTAKINDLDSKLQRTGDEDERSKIKGEITKIVNEYSKLFEELNGLDSKQPKKEVGQQAELTNNSIKLKESQKKDDLTVVKEQFKKGLEKAGINTEGMSNKEISQKLKDNFLLNAQYEMIKEFEGKSEQQAKPDAEKAVGNKAARIPLTDSVQKLVSNASEVNQSAPLPKSSRIKPIYNMPIIPLDPRMQEHIDQHETSRVDGTKLNHESKHDINNNPEGKFTQQVSQKREISGQQKNNGKSM
ncbi:MAG: hypothetical protein sL5_04800 [Candidatus Mesenet longicola]|uniref:Uncharacterized protein n=1 Tax=Candidatus Mesenet longicola TaxID=1892558 RepID=A0A8J3MQF1_9RICK|nr:MAG: hypothetical protein sGL2_04920 [Candidatus Mesenet longicola]GHM59487.1 MAG: hypothetical protein sL5_04800 [Candidatus Mesenet longicola]